MLHFSKADFKRSLNTRKPFKNKLKTFLKERETERDRDRERERDRETETERERQREREREREGGPKIILNHQRDLENYRDQVLHFFII